MIRLAIGVFFIVLPFLEMILLVKLTYALGFLSTLTLMIVAAVAGSMVLAQQSAATFRQALEATSRGAMPKTAVLDGMFLMLAGILLIIPGLITDAMALLLLIPPVRRWIALHMMQGFIRTASEPDPDADQPRGGSGRGPFEGSTRPGPARQAKSGPGPVIEGEFQRLDERPPRDGGHS